MSILTQQPVSASIEDWCAWVDMQLKRASLFYGHGTVDSLDEARVIVLSVAQLCPDVQIIGLSKKLTKSEQKTIKKVLLERINTRKPLAYLLNEAWFANLQFFVDERVIIPRSPLAELIEAKFVPWVKPSAVMQILDLCSGSGCIAIACATYFPDAFVTAIDNSEAAMEVAALNVNRHQMSEQLKLIRSDLFAELVATKFDIIVSNPPYVDQAEYQSLPQEYSYEPKSALVALDKGLNLVEKILYQAKNYLNPEGILVVEVGNSEVALVERYPHVPFMWLEFQRGGQGVFLLTAEQLEEYF